MINRLAVIGVGLIGGSFSLALKKSAQVKEVVGYGRHLESLKQAQSLNIIDRYESRIDASIATADVIMIAAPVSAFESIFEQIKPYLNANTIITDAGSTKQNVINSARKVFGSIPENFVPGHPIAGTEQNGPKSAFAELFNDHKVILTPLEQTRESAKQTIIKLWQHTGAQVVEMSAEHHDWVLGATSHLPHVIAYSLVYSLTTLNERKEVFDYAAGGFKDFTRIASSNPEMWRDICLANKEMLIEHLSHFQEDLDTILDALKISDGNYLQDIFTQAKNTRDKLLNNTGNES